MIALAANKGLVIYIDDIDGDLANLKWSSDRKGYAHRRVNRTTERMHRVILSRVLGRPLTNEEQVDHINCNKSDNRRCNLRLATNGQNQVNTPDRGVIRVQKSPRSRVRWRARVRFEGKLIHIGYFNSESEAHAAYNKRRAELFGEYAYAPPKPIEMPPDLKIVIPTKRWSRKHTCCIRCSSTERKHQGNGHCTRCRHYR